MCILRVYFDRTSSQTFLEFLRHHVQCNNKIRQCMFCRCNLTKYPREASWTSFVILYIAEQNMLTCVLRVLCNRTSSRSVLVHLCACCGCNLTEAFWCILSEHLPHNVGTEHLMLLRQIYFPGSIIPCIVHIECLTHICQTCTTVAYES